MNKLPPEQRRNKISNVYLTALERETLKSNAKRTGLTASDYLRNLALNIPLPSFEKNNAIDNLLKINSDLARLGNLLKLAISEEYSEEKINTLIDEISDVKENLKDKILNL
ncbi:MAG: pirin [Alphaproteobacteria bacterium]|nr:pirin [Alphaproteobacteria bacterium]